MHNNNRLLEFKHQTTNVHYKTININELNKHLSKTHL